MLKKFFFVIVVILIVFALWGIIFYPQFFANLNGMR